MFDKLKQLNELRKMQGELKQERLTVERRGVSVTINGALDIEEVKLNAELTIQDQESAIKEVLNEVKQQMQKKLAQKMMGMGIGF